MSEDAVRVDVVVFGGGVTGLTVAHELAERNFRVAVVEPEFRGPPPELPAPDQENPGLGGVAKSQWGFVPNDQDRRDPLQTPHESTEMMPLPPRPPGTEPLLVEYRDDVSGVAFGDLVLTEDADPQPSFVEALGPFIRAMGEHRDWQLVCSLYDPRPTTTRAQTQRALRDAMLAADKHLTPETAEAWIKQRVRINHMDPHPSRARVALLEFNLFHLPGEHGFRFFPSFYRHIFDMLKRIPATSPTDLGRRGRDTVYDNLVSVEQVGYVSVAPGPMALMARSAPRSAADVRHLLREMRRETRFTDQDMKRLAGKVWKYMTSSRLRREREYEHTSWYDYVEGDRFSQRGSFLVETMPGTLVGLLGSDGDARTQGTTLVQLMADQLTRGHQSDMLLNGPTDEAWFGHWYRYLVDQGVAFVRGALTDFALDAAGATLEPVVKRDRDGGDEPANRLRFEADARSGAPVLYVIALPLLEANAVAARFLEAYERHRDALAGDGPPRDLVALRAFAGLGPEALRAELRKPYPRGPLRHLSGIQYFFNQDVKLSQAHLHYLEAPAGLTAIAQPQFWLQRQNDLSGYRSVLSVDIGIWARPRFRRPPPDDYPTDWYPWGRTRQEIAENIWQQMALAHEGDFPRPWPRLPRPSAYLLDRHLVFDPATGALCDDRSPFLVNETGRYRARPGGVAPRAAPWKATIRYDAALGRYVLAGNYMQTYTRITSMESACESARHAVNRLLELLDLAGEPCRIWDPEDHEHGAFETLKELDEELCARGLPHMTEIAGRDVGDEWSMPFGGWSELIQSARSARRR